MLKKICKFINDKESNHDIMDCYEEYLDAAIDRNTLVEICQNVLGNAREDLKVYPDFHKYAAWLGIGDETV